MARPSKPKAARKTARPKKAKPARPKKARPPALTPFEARCLRERYKGDAEVARWLASVAIREEPA